MRNDIRTFETDEYGIIGYKAFNYDLTCRGFQYEIGKEYTCEGEVELCRNGFHFCEKLMDCFDYYDARGCEEGPTRVCRIRAYGKIVTDGHKYACERIYIEEEVEDDSKLWNFGRENCGYANFGDSNKGSRNNGNDNVGYCNIGNENVGSCNEYNNNIGNRNKGSFNWGTENIGNHNIGLLNSGHSNLGIGNNTDYACGYFNTRPTLIMIFNKPYYGGRGELEMHHLSGVNALLRIMSEEKVSLDFVVNCVGALGLNDIQHLPNFDQNVFEELTGLNFEELCAYVNKSLEEGEEASLISPSVK